MGAQHAQAERETLANRIGELENDAATRHRELGTIDEGVRYFKEWVSAGKTWASTVGVWARDNLKSDVRGLLAH